MSIAASEIYSAIDLGGGMTSITERHTDSIGGVHEWRYVASAGMDTAVKLAEHAALLAEQLAAAEADEVIG